MKATLTVEFVVELENGIDPDAVTFEIPIESVIPMAEGSTGRVGKLVSYCTQPYVGEDPQCPPAKPIEEQGRTPETGGRMKYEELQRRHSAASRRTRLRDAEAELAEMKPTEPLPPDPEEMNNDRADWAHAAILEFAMQTGSDGPDLLSDLLADLMHWADRHGLNFDGEVERGRNHYDEETLPDKH
jgi:hypothetical protein